MPRHPLPDVLGDAFRVREASAVGVTRSRLEARDLERPFHGVRLRRIPPSSRPEDPDVRQRDDIRRRARAAALVLPEQSFFVGLTALAILGLPLLGHRDDVTAAVHAPARAPRGRGVAGSRVSPSLANVAGVDGMRVATPASVWALLAEDLDERDLVVVGDAVVRIPRDDRGHPILGRRLATIDQLRAAAEAPRRRGRGKLRAALDRIRVGSSSPLETDFRLEVVAAGLPEPDLDVEIRDHRGRLVGIADAVYPRQRVIVEVEGDHHRTTRQQWDRDIEKHAAYSAEGWDLVRLTSRHIRAARPRAVPLVRAALLRGGGTG